MKKPYPARKPVMLGLFFGLCMMCTAPAAYADAVCSTPDGLIYQDGRLMAPGGKGIGGTGDRAANTKGLGGTGNRVADGKGKGNGKGIGGTGNKVAEKGIGGTGDKVAEGKGIGGTGNRIALRGTITGFASICVNGSEVHYNEKTPLSLDGKPLDTGALRVGQVVSVVAEPAPQGGFNARAIDVTPGIVGPVQAVQAGAGFMQVMGQNVRVAPENAAAFSPGDVVRVSGMRDAGNVVVATLVEKVSPNTPPQVALESRLDVSTAGRVSLEGYVHGISGEAVEIDGHKVILPEDIRDDVAPNARVLVYGLPDIEGRIHAETIAVEERILIVPDTDMHLPLRDDDGRIEHEEHEHEEEFEQEEHEDEFEGEEHEIEEHEFEEPESEAQEFEEPEIEEPEIESPEIETPEIETPEIETPEIEVPEIETPEIETPEIEVPEIETPEIETPEIEVPEIEEPEL